jgi:type VI secretion system secreted protein VgrG
VEAEGDELQLLGRKNVTVQSYDDWVNITGKQGVLINGGGSYLKVWAGGIEYGTKETWRLHARTNVFKGPKNMEAPEKESSTFCLECWLKAARDRKGIMQP